MTKLKWEHEVQECSWLWWEGLRMEFQVWSRMAVIRDGDRIEPLYRGLVKNGAQDALERFEWFVNQPPPPAQEPPPPDTQDLARGAIGPGDTVCAGNAWWVVMDTGDFGHLIVRPEGDPEGETSRVFRSDVEKTRT